MDSSGGCGYQRNEGGFRRRFCYGLSVGSDGGSDGSDGGGIAGAVQWLGIDASDLRAGRRHARWCGRRRDGPRRYETPQAAG